MKNIPPYNQPPEDSSLVKPEILNTPNDPIEQIASNPQTERWVDKSAVITEHDPNAHIVSYTELPADYYNLNHKTKQEIIEKAEFGYSDKNVPHQIHALKIGGDRIDVTGLINDVSQRGTEAPTPYHHHQLKNELDTERAKLHKESQVIYETKSSGTRAYHQRIVDKISGNIRSLSKKLGAMKASKRKQNENLAHLVSDTSGMDITTDTTTGLKVIKDQIADLTQNAGLYKKGDENINLIIQKPSFETIHRYGNEDLYTVEEGDKWKTMSTKRGAKGHIQFLGNTTLPAGEKLIIDLWEVGLSKNGKSFVLTNQSKDTLKFDTLKLRIAVEGGNTLLKKRCINPKHLRDGTFAGWLLIGQDQRGTTYFREDELRDLIYATPQSDEGGDEIFIKGEKWLTEEVSEVSNQQAKNSEYMIDRDLVLDDLRKSYGEGTRLIRTYMARGNKKYQYMTLLLPVDYDKDGTMVYDAFVECPEYGNAAFFVPHEKGDWREIIIGQSKQDAEQYGAIRQPHPPFDENWNEDEKTAWREEWKDTALKLIFREHGVFKKPS